MTNKSKIRVLLADDHNVVRLGLKTAISRQSTMEVVAEAANGIEAIEAYEKHEPDVVVMDLRMPQLNGILTIQKLNEIYKKPKILVYSSFASGEEIYTAFKSGACGFIVKDMSLDQLVEAIQTVNSSGQYLPPEISGRMALTAATNLTVREMEVLSCIARGMSNKEIGEELGLAAGTVKIHLSNMLTKLGVSDRTQALLAGLKRGIIEIN